VSNIPPLLKSKAFCPSYLLMVTSHCWTTSIYTPKNSLSVEAKQLPFQIKTTFYESKKTGKCEISVTPRLPSDKAFESLKLTIHCSTNTLSCKSNASAGSFTFDPTSKVAVWDVGKVDGDVAMHGIPTLCCNFETEAAESFKSISIYVDFKISAFSCSGIAVESLSVLNERYKPYKGYVALTKNGTVEVRYIK
jgi:AP-3 complex subunit mu